MIGVEANLRAEFDGIRVRVDSRADVITCRIDGGPVDLLAGLRRSRRLLPVLRAVIPLLVRTNIRLDIAVGKVRVGRAGRGVRQNGPARLLRLPATHIGG